ncbi:chemotaxis protein CheA [Cellulomonas sp.]|uniref:chemotaxis protein CheA n=1 Tax=Cellulomonas sp. TaxID=40001 RepID=UPI002811F543|nr:chemotaxis protein CheA [Cellulomonas sp.]
MSAPDPAPGGAAVLPAPHEPPQAERTAPAEPRPAPAGDEPAHRAAVGDSAIRVDVALLDVLVRQVGELVLARNRISRLAAAADDPDLVRSAQRLDVIAGELQEGVMRTRMQPIEHLWSKMPRVVRDLAAACGREVALDLSGGETELDRSLLEAVRDPLTHLVRNAVDHGIEPPDVRVAAGKPPKGRLALRALHAGGQVVIEVSDDGRGIDAAAVAAKAVERGLRTPEQVAAASTGELLNLLFLPGFSTAASVTNVSGRGVGMDVVRTKIEAVGGTVDVETTPGAGTVWRLRMPLTLAIIPALTVECAGRVYALPQTNVLELVAADGRSGTSAVEHVHGAPVLRLRDRLLPLVLLGTALGVSDATQPPPGSVVIAVQVDRYHFGVVVDRVLTTEEIVVESLSARLKAAGAYSGATVLGDGTLALILDLQSLARRSLLGEAEQVVEDVPEDVAVADPGEEVLVVSVDDRRLCLPSALVTRLEPVHLEQVERVGGRDVLRYRGEILPLTRVDRLVGAGPGGDEQIVVVVARGARAVGLVVHAVLDFDRDHAADHSPVADVGLLGSTVVGGRVTERLDWEAAVRAADPTFLDDETETSDELLGAVR